jgi:hypothetical protein
MGMRVMREPYGPTLMIAGAVLVGLLLLSVIFLLNALAIFFLRRSRVFPHPPPGRAP